MITTPKTLTNGYTTRRRVVITGLGPISCVGIGKEALWDALVSGRSGISRLTGFDVSDYPTKIGGQIENFTPTDFMSEKSVKVSARFSHLAVASARLAYEDSGLTVSDLDPRKIGVCLGSSALGWGDIAATQHERFLRRGYRHINPFANAEFTTHMATTHVCSELNIKGINATISTGCSTAFDAINWAFSQIKQGQADVVVAGGADAPLFPFMFASFCAVRVLSTRNEEPERASRPYDRLRDGIVLSEGGASIIIEELEHARERGAHIYAEILGYGSAAEAMGTLEVEESGDTVARAMEISLSSARLLPGDIDYINAHGCSLPGYDRSETRAVKKVFGERAYRIPISSSKSVLGQSLAAASGYQIISSCFSFRDGLLPPTINYEHPDPECDLDYIPNQSRHNRVRKILMNSHSVGGTHSVVIIGEYTE